MGKKEKIEKERQAEEFMKGEENSSNSENEDEVDMLDDQFGHSKSSLWKL